MDDLKLKANKALDCIAGGLASVECGDTTESLTAIADIARYIGWLEGQLMSKNSLPPISMPSPFAPKPPFEPGDSPFKPFSYPEPKFADGTTTDGAKLEVFPKGLLDGNPSLCPFDTPGGCNAAACYNSTVKCNSRDKDGNPMY